MLETFIHMSFAFVVFTGVVYFSIFSWLKKHEGKDGIDCQSDTLKRGLKASLKRPLEAHTH